ncbi:MAG: anti-sigma factor domain-containing protein [Nonlabens sp.]|uniref:anti-sigma factor domain-containing protein n=1 Tax=Nonlabens sp. TaxID=1888209 RepID=UPI003EF56117
MRNEEKNIKDFLESGLLDQYVIGATNEKDTLAVEYMISRYPEIKTAFQELEEELRLYATMNAEPLPNSLKERVLQELAPSSLPTKVNEPNWLSVAAAIVALVALAGLGYLYNQNSALKEEIVESTFEYEKLEKDYELNDSQKRILEMRLAFIESADTDKYLMRGFINEEPLRVIAYYNQPAGMAQIEIAALPDLKDSQDYQLWADVNGEMKSLAIINDLKPKTISAELLKNASDLNITIEKAGGTKTASVENLVATIPLNKRP